MGIGAFISAAKTGFGLAKKAIKDIDDKVKKDVDVENKSSGKIKLEDKIDDDKIKVRY